MCNAVRNIMNKNPDWNLPCPPVPLVCILSFFHTEHLRISNVNTAENIDKWTLFLLNWWCVWKKNRAVWVWKLKTVRYRPLQWMNGGVDSRKFELLENPLKKGLAWGIISMIRGWKPKVSALINVERQAVRLKCEDENCDMQCMYVPWSRFSEGGSQPGRLGPVAPVNLYGTSCSNDTLSTIQRNGPHMRGFALVFDDPVAARTMKDKEWPLGQSKLRFLFVHSVGRAMGQFSFSHLDRTACIFTLI